MMLHVAPVKLGKMACAWASFVAFGVDMCEVIFGLGLKRMFEGSITICLHILNERIFAEQIFVKLVGCMLLLALAFFLLKRKKNEKAVLGRPYCKQCLALS